MRTVKEILKSKGPHFNWVDANATVRDAIGLMKSENISYLIVRENNEYAGIITERDYTHKVILQDKHSDTTLVKEIMTVDLPVVALSDTAEQCMMLMNSSKTRYLLAFDGSAFMGVITIHDLMREAIAAHEQHGRWCGVRHPGPSAILLSLESQIKSIVFDESSGYICLS